MGIFSSINKAISNVGQTKFAEKARSLVGTKASATIANVANKALTVLTSPIAAIKDFKAAEKKTLQAQPLTLVAKGALVAATVAAPFSGAVRSGAVTAAKAAAPVVTKSLVGTPARAATTVLAAGVLTASPTVRSAAVNLPKTIFSTGKTIGTAIEKSPDKEGLGGIAAKGAVLGAGAALLAGGLLVAPKVIDKLKKDDVPVLVNGQQVGTLASKEPEPTTIPTKTPGQVGTTTTKRKRRAKQTVIKNSVKLINNNNIAIAR